MQEISNWTAPAWIVEALKALRPPGKMTVSQWADENRILGIGESSRPGRWKTDFVPYLRDVMDAFNDPEVEEIDGVKSTQVGGTEAMLNMMGYAVCCDPGPMLVVYPKDTLVEYASDHRIQPMINATPELKKKFDSNSKREDLRFSGGIYIGIVSANSPSDLASRPIRYLFLDEEDKFPERAGKEASPAALAMERQGTYQLSKKTVRISTPVFEQGVTWQNWLSANTQMQCFVKCPHCGAEWTFQFKQLKWPEGATEDQAREQAFYVCEECGAVINDVQRMAMIKQCRWKATKTDGSRRRIAFHLNVFYSPWKRLGDIAAEFLKSKDKPELLQNFINSWLAEPFKEVELKLNSEKLLETRQSIYRAEEVPPRAVLLTGGVDVQKHCFYWTIRAWMINTTSYNVAHGQAFTWQEIEQIMNTWYADRDGKQYQVNLCGIDSGDQTFDVYDFCAVNSDWSIPVKGASGRMNTPCQLSKINKDGLANGMLLGVVDTNYYKDMIFARMLRDEEHGGWYLHDECDPEYAEMITSEEKVIERMRGHLVRHWVQKATGADNHYLDCEVYAACVADLKGLRTLSARAEQEKRMEESPDQQSSAVEVEPVIYENEQSKSMQHTFRQRRKTRRWT